MDPISLTLGILPIAFAAVQGLSILQQKIQLLRHYRREVKWLRTKVGVQARCFKGEIHHLFIDTLDARKAQSLIRDNDHAHWGNKDLDGTLAEHLGELSPEFITAILEIKAASEQIAAKLARFAPPDVTSPLLKATKDKFRLAFRKEEYNEDIRTLKEWIAELKRIRKLARAIQKQSVAMATATATAKETQKEQSEPMAGRYAGSDLTTVRQYRAVRRLSWAFQALLLQQWSCGDCFHSHHGGRLFLRCMSQQNCIAWLLEYAGRHGCISVSNRLLFNVSHQPLGLMTPEESPGLNNPFEYFGGPTPKRLKISAQGHVPGDLIAKKSEASDCGNEYHGADEASSEDTGGLCRQLEACSVTSTPPARPRVFSYVDVQRREQFMFEPKPAEAQSLGGWDTHKVTSLMELLNHRIRDVMLDRERIQLALALVRGTLMNHSTPGWPQGCVMEGISFFNDSDADVDVSALLNTLNIQIQAGNCLAPDTPMEGSSVRVSEDELQYTFGIRNQVLYCLGAALLSIGLWSNVGWEDVPAVRRKAAALDSLGKNFTDAVKRLIHSDFGVDTADLSNERLQVEILRAVVVPLERLAELHRQAEPERWPEQAAPNWSSETSNAIHVR